MSDKNNKRIKRRFRGALTGAILCLGTIWLLAACSTRNVSLRHPVQQGLLFQAPIVDLDSYRSVEDRSANDRALAVAVAISGGGERAANFGVGVLLGLEALPSPTSVRDVLQEVDYLSTVSGGGMAAAAYVSTLHSHRTVSGNPRETFRFSNVMRRRSDDLPTACTSSNVLDFYQDVVDSGEDPTTDPCIRRHLERGYHGNIFSSFFNPKIIFSSLDRGDILEQTFAKELLGGNWLGYVGAAEMQLRDLFPHKRSGIRPRLPMWVANATIMENGAILPFVPDVLSLYQIREYVHDMSEVTINQGVSHYDFAESIPLSLGLTASGNFPSLIAPQTLGAEYDAAANPYMHLIDGGIADNLGIHTAITLLQHPLNSKSKKLLIVVDAYPGEFAPYSRGKGGPNFLSVFFKLPSMPLDGARGRARQTLRSFQMGDNTSVVYLSFDDLYRPSNDDIHEEDPDAVTALFDELQAFYSDEAISASKHVEVRTDNPELKSPFQIARKVKTSYNITDAEQDFLLAVGKYLVDKNRSKILAALGGETHPMEP